ncbi:peptide ABC transporter substrate-binding protein [Luethyella okanaganae]|uniref:ABC transporter substrate-binding protein n=1 Tax=Luethyella okanaganae TaxID=69372 RepID=A0ABW1VDA9_9MICO
MKIKRFGVAAIALAAAGALTLSGCATGGGGSSTKGSSSAIITVNGTEPQNPLVPAITNEVGGGKILDSIFAGLVYYDALGAPVNDVAESITTDDAKNYTIKIKGDQKFTNGEKVTAKSFVDAWNYTSQAEGQTFAGSYFFSSIAGYEDAAAAKLTGLKVVDDTTFTVELSQSESDFPLRLGYSAFFPLPEAAFKDIAAFGENPIGNGPYMFASDKAWAHNEKIELVANPDYNGDRKAQNGGVTFVLYSSEDASYADLLSGNLDILDSIPASSLGSYQADLGDRAVNQPAAIFQSFTIPARLPHFGGEEGRLRRAALSMAINRDEITKVIFNETRTPAHDFTSPVIDGYSDSLAGSEVLKYNPDEAKKLWAKADAISPWTGTFQIGYNADSSHQAWVDAVTNGFKNVLGIDASGAPVPTFAEFRTSVTDRAIQTAFRTGWQADYPALYNFLGPLYGTGAGSNDGDYSNPEFDALLKKGLAETDLKTANKVFQDAQVILLKDLPAIPLWYATVNGGYGEAVSNVQFGWNSVPLYYEVTKSE